MLKFYSASRAVLGCNKNIRLYRYDVGQRFGKHIDEAVRDDDIGAVSEHTILIYLNGGGGGSDTTDEAKEPLEGGHTVFYKGNTGTAKACTVTPRQGACLVHGHGRRCLTHEGAVVTRGVKFLLRTDVMYEA
ncbi:unnamed protein product [Phaeothamnion confervicola]